MLGVRLEDLPPLHVLSAIGAAVLDAVRDGSVTVPTHHQIGRIVETGDTQIRAIGDGRQIRVLVVPLAKAEIQRFEDLYVVSVIALHQRPRLGIVKPHNVLPEINASRLDLLADAQVLDDLIKVVPREREDSLRQSQGVDFLKRRRPIKALDDDAGIRPLGVEGDTVVGDDDIGLIEQLPGKTHQGVVVTRILVIQLELIESDALYLGIAKPLPGDREKVRVSAPSKGGSARRRPMYTRGLERSLCPKEGFGDPSAHAHRQPASWFYPCVFPPGFCLWVRMNLSSRFIRGAWPLRILLRIVPERWDSRVLLAALLDVVADELFGVCFEHVVNLVQQVIHVFLESFTITGRTGRRGRLGGRLGTGSGLLHLRGHRGLRVA